MRYPLLIHKLSVYQKPTKWGKISIKWDKVVCASAQTHVNSSAQVELKNHQSHQYITHMIIGEYRHTIDDKNRLSLPAKFRKEMGKKVVITPGLDSCLFIFTVKQWEKISERLSMSESSMLQADNRSFNRYLLGGAVEAEVDAAGRMLLPEHLRSRAKLENKVVFIGVRDRVELWDENVWNAYRTGVEEKADALAEKLGNAGML
jgi:MraZ protein